MSEEKKKSAIKLKKKIRLGKKKKKSKSCDELKKEYKNGTLKKDLNDNNYTKLLKCLEIIHLLELV